MTFKILIICILAGAGAGLSTGFAGLSAAVYVTPMLVAFLDVPVYDAVGIALASDIFASAFSALSYGRHGHIDLRRGRLLMLFVLIFAIIGSVIAYLISSTELGSSLLGWWSIVSSFILGIVFICRAGKGRNDLVPDAYSGLRKVLIVLCGMYIGFVCGFQGTGGGMMLLFVLTTVMQFEFKTAVGTSVFIMAFTALIGAVAHFLVSGLPDLPLLLLCMVSTTAFAELGAQIAARITATKLKRITGIMLALSGIAMLLVKGFRIYS